jgi:redox-sensitive bicupin YhaK (pirin superfamily)
MWIARLEAQGECAAASEYIAPAEVLLGEFGQARSRVRQAPADVNCSHVRLTDRQHYRHAAADGHNVTWLAIDRGSLQRQCGERCCGNSLPSGDSGGVIEVQADGETSFASLAGEQIVRPFGRGFCE